MPNKMFFNPIQVRHDNLWLSATQAKGSTYQITTPRHIPPRRRRPRSLRHRQRRLQHSIRTIRIRFYYMKND
jgi:hypothetical protein